jgi:AraC-like DNA-binding protein
MPATLSAIETGRLERSCGARGGSIRVGSGGQGIERVEAFFMGRAFEPHRHDTYAIGITTRGVQAFRYRGTLRRCLPGQLHVLHPDELHDGASATAAGFAYRIMYVEPWLIQESLGGRPLPFVADPVQDSSPVTAAVVALLADIDEPIDELAGADAGAVIADGLLAVAGAPAAAGAIDLAAVRSVREYIDAHPTDQTRAEQLERIAGIDRWAVARQFRAAYGTSPDRYRTMRRLAVARRAIAAGAPLVEAALNAGFADQSHMSRQFRRAYGVTPGRWAAATGTKERRCPQPVG